MELRDHIALQDYAARYIRYLGGTLCKGRFALENMVWRYVESGFTASPSELVRQEAQKKQKTPDAIRRNVQHFLQRAPFNFSDQSGILRWQELGWDGEAPLSPFRGIRLVCQGFFPYLERHYPEIYQRLLAFTVPSETPPLVYLEAMDQESERLRRQSAAGEELDFGNMYDLTRKLEEYQKEIDEVREKLAAGEQLVFDSVDALFRYLEEEGT